MASAMNVAGAHSTEAPVTANAAASALMTEAPAAKAYQRPRPMRATRGVEERRDDRAGEPERLRAEVIVAVEDVLRDDEVQRHEDGADGEEDVPGHADARVAEADDAGGDEGERVDDEQQHLEGAVDALAAVGDVDERGDDGEECAGEEEEVGLLLGEPGPVVRRARRDGERGDGGLAAWLDHHAVRGRAAATEGAGAGCG